MDDGLVYSVFDDGGREWQIRRTGGEYTVWRNNTMVVREPLSTVQKAYRVLRDNDVPIRPSVY